MPITGVVTVTTPQDIALIDVIKSVNMYNRMGIPCLGVVENMSMHICSNCGHSEAIFGSDGGEKLAQEFNFKILAKLPLDIKIRDASDNGRPIVEVNNVIADIYKDFATKMLNNLSQLPKDYSVKIGKVSVVKE